MIINVGGSTGAATADNVKYGESNVGAALNTLEGELTANNNRIYMDYKEGKYGYNTDPLRGADTFIPFSSGVTPVLLWTNPNPSDEFYYETVSLNLSKYKTIVVASNFRNGVIYNGFFPNPCVDNPLGSYYRGGNFGFGYARGVTVNDSGVTFTNNVGSNSSTTNNGNNIPQRIYGIEINIIEGLN